ncbi:DsrH/TusB family sulfur metabolism protein [Acinetobacter faecalis]|uniref:DsrH/TusB family sulfur metabolism protein n=1 Tax=Acinetobacter faecalis TaxID=2665161 RepID=UPI002A9092E9|nr:DsrH/TusB family sulfur metabolism protein [Acinetobacter faecalis]MDY6489310.1 DsrH/TusB family sulfur metabolism protein [Acinetobacter faecalis]MDY6510948.1 DsrH/TusB family sulfur metabolism protein [Acinetobacter faecalis]MDY6530265.1 DsrH/TusB family sulfur metabolism protein [Acinetobacter faecalis]
MTNNTLYLVQSSFNESPAMLEKLKQLYITNDAVVLMGEAVLYASAVLANGINQIYVLENEAENLAQLESAQIEVISYNQFADLALKFKRSIRLK